MRERRAAYGAIKPAADDRKIEAGDRPYDIHDWHALRAASLVGRNDERRQYAEADGDPGDRLQQQVVRNHYRLSVRWLEPGAPRAGCAPARRRALEARWACQCSDCR